MARVAPPRAVLDEPLPLSNCGNNQGSFVSIMIAPPPPAPAPTRSDRVELPVWLTDGQGELIRIRRVDPADAEGIRSLHARCSETTLRRRYFTLVPQVEHLLSWVFDADQGLCLVAETGGQLIGLGHLMAPEWTGAAEVAFMVDDHFQGRGIGPALVDLVLRVGREQHYPSLHAEVTMDNGKMRQILVRRGFSSIPEVGGYAMDLPLP